MRMRARCSSVDHTPGYRPSNDMYHVIHTFAWKVFLNSALVSCLFDFDNAIWEIVSFLENQTKVSNVLMP